jgi:hypothetical protein
MNNIEEFYSKLLENYNFNRRNYSLINLKKNKMSSKLEYRQKLLDKLVSDCITYRLTEKEALQYIEKEYGKPISSKTYFNIKARVESDESNQAWFNQFTRIGFVQLHRKLVDNLMKIYEDNMNRFFVVSQDIRGNNKRDEELILKLNREIRENTKLLSELSLGTPIIAALKSRLLEQHEIEYNNDNTKDEQRQRREQEEQEGLTAEPWDNNHWSQCCKCQRWFKTELIEGICHNCAPIPEPIL